ncbi:MAG TPA: phosphonate ABC transporter, permease protein PhnE [Symbiobacteriaceae bacterium]|jgi:phosphonate transport system permease protein
MTAVWRKYASTFWLLVTALLIYWSTTGLVSHTTSFKETWPQTLHIFSQMFVHAEWSYMPELAGKLLETIQMAILGTLLASILAVPFGFLAAKNTAKKLAVAGKFLLDLIRVFPEVILAIIFIKGVGPGPLAGILAMGFHSVGMLGKLYSESVEAIDRGPMEALVSTGASRIQQVWFAVIPQVLPEFASYAIYRFEINSRAATVLGIVGAGGIGAPLIFAIQARAWNRVGIILIGIIVVVTAIDFLSGWLRKKLV